MLDLFAPMRACGAEVGLNLIATVPVTRYDAHAAEPYQARRIRPSARTIIVIANGGRAFWTAFLEHCATHPGWRDRLHPLDDFTRYIVEQRLMPLVSGAQPVYPFVGDGPTLNFMQLGISAGLAGPSLLGVVINPTYGPWIAFRAALLIDADLNSATPESFDPCPRCAPRTCIPACPIGAITPTGWDIPKCLTYRLEVEADCAPRCHARAACVIAPDQRYSDDELAYHQERALGAMRLYARTRR